MDQSPRSLLLYTDGEVMGDGIIRLPLLASIKKQFPQLSITRLTSDASIYDTALSDLAHPYFDAAIRIDAAMPWRDFVMGPQILAGQRFDLILDTQRRIKRALWLRGIAHGRFASAAGNYLFSDMRPRAAIASLRMVDQLRTLAEAALGVPLPLEPLVLQNPEWVRAANAALPGGASYVGFVVGAGHPSKRWPLAQFIALAHAIEAQGHAPVFFLGPSEQELFAPLREALPEAHFPLSVPAMCDVKNPCFTVALAGRLRGAIANDSGGGHLLAAGGCPMVSLFRAASVRAKFTPSAPRVHALAPEDFGGRSIEDIPYAAARDAVFTLLHSR